MEAAKNNNAVFAIKFILVSDFKGMVFNLPMVFNLFSA